MHKSRDSAVDIATGYGLDDQGVGVRVARGGQEFSIFHVVETGCAAHPASYAIGIVDCFYVGKATGA
jgi:hypothetical protein